MKLLNIGCGATRPPDPWVNLDQLHSELLPYTPARVQLDSEPNYVNASLLEPLPFLDETFDGILASHVLEHFDCLQGVAVLKECRRTLKPGGSLVVSVPDASYFRKVNAEDNKENCHRLFGQPLYEKETFLDYALFFIGHKQVFSEDTLWCHLRNAGFYDIFEPGLVNHNSVEARAAIMKILNRNKFSLVLSAFK